MRAGFEPVIPRVPLSFFFPALPCWSGARARHMLLVVCSTCSNCLRNLSALGRDDTDSVRTAGTPAEDGAGEASERRRC